MEEVAPAAIKQECTKSMSETLTSEKDQAQIMEQMGLLPTRELTQLLKSRMALGESLNPAPVGLTSAQHTAHTLTPHQVEEVLLAAVLLLALLTRPERTRLMWRNSIFGKVQEQIMELMDQSRTKVSTQLQRLKTALGGN